MKTLEMMKEAGNNGKTYFINDLYYNTKRGFTDEYGNQWESYAFEYINELFEYTGWEELIKSLSWQEAIEVHYKENKTVRFEGSNGVDFITHVFKPYKTINIHTYMIDDTGKWYIED